MRKTSEMTRRGPVAVIIAKTNATMIDMTITITITTTTGIDMT
jgi:hypothetical protein